MRLGVVRNVHRVAAIGVCVRLNGMPRALLPTSSPPPRKLTACLLGFGLALASGGVAARDYAVEVIVFDRLTQEIRTDAQWDLSSRRIDEHLRRMAALADEISEPDTSRENSRETSKEDTSPEISLEDTSHETSRELANLEPARVALIESGYRILNTTRWRQPGSLYQNAPLIPLGDGDNALASGFVRIYTTTLIYADVNLQLSPLLPESADAPSGDADWVADTDLGADADADLATRQPHYFIAEKRRLKFTEVHYFDHPYFGAILGVWPVDESEDGLEQDALQSSPDS